MSADLNTRLGAVIRQKRVLLGLSQEALAKRMGITFQQVQKYEKGTNQVAFPRLVALAEALGTTASKLVAAALDEAESSRDGLSNRMTLELVKRLDGLPENQRRSVQLLVRNLAEAG